MPSTTWRRNLAGRLARFADGSERGRRVAARVAALDRILQNDSSASATNGEFWLLEQLARPDPLVVFGVGAHKGEWSTQVLQRCPAAKVYAFEPVPAIHARLEAALGGDPRVRVVRAALSAGGTEELVMWSRGAADSMSSAVRADRLGVEEIRVPCMTGDRFLAEQAIPHVDLLKIDVEGHELEVLEGFREAFGRGAIDLVQFEFTLWAVHARRWLADFYEFFDGFGYPIGRLMPARVAWKAYQPEDERFLRFNYVAARPGSDPARRLGAPAAGAQPGRR